MRLKDGLIVGADSGAVALVAIDLAKMPENHNKLVVALLQSHGGGSGQRQAWVQHSQILLLICTGHVGQLLAPQALFL